MGRYLIRRLAESVVTFVLVTIVVFIGVRALPGDPARALAGEESDPATVEADPARRSAWTSRSRCSTSSTSATPCTATSAAPPAPGCRWPDSIGHAIPVTLQLAVFAIAIAALHRRRRRTSSPRSAAAGRPTGRPTASP